MMNTINDVLLSGLQGNRTAMAFALLYNGLNKYEKAKNCAKSNPKLSLLAGDKAVINRREGEWSFQNVDKGNELFKGVVSFTFINKEEKGEFLLGDFKSFGRFLGALSYNVGREYGKSV